MPSSREWAAMDIKHSLIIYVDGVSPYSRQLMEDLRSAHVRHVMKHPDARIEDAVEMYTLTGQSVVPVIRLTSDVDDIVFVGYTQAARDKIEELLGVKLPAG